MSGGHERTFETMQISGRFFGDVSNGRFEGQFTIDTTTGQLFGRMSDVYGSACFVGLLLEDSMCYQKTYVGEQPVHRFPITYDYRRGTSEWDGQYRYGPGDLWVGGAVCSLGSPVPRYIDPEDFQLEYDLVSTKIRRRRYEMQKRIDGINE